MATNKKDKPQLKWKKKKWYTITAPATFNHQEIGETAGSDEASIVNRTVQVNLMHLTKNPRKQNITITYKINEVSDAKARTQTHKYSMLPASIKRFVRAGRDRVDESFIIKSNDGIYARIKPLIITKGHEPASIKTKIRRTCISYIRKDAAQFSLEDYIKKVVDGNVQKELSIALNKLCGIRTCEIRMVEIIENFTSVKEKKLQREQDKEKILEQKLEEERARKLAHKEEELKAKPPKKAPQELELEEEQRKKEEASEKTDSEDEQKEE